MYPARAEISSTVLVMAVLVLPGGALLWSGVSKNLASSLLPLVLCELV